MPGTSSGCASGWCTGRGGTIRMRESFSSFRSPPLPPRSLPELRCDALRLVSLRFGEDPDVDAPAISGGSITSSVAYAGATRPAISVQRETRFSLELAMTLTFSASFRSSSHERPISTRARADAADVQSRGVSCQGIQSPATLLRTARRAQLRPPGRVQRAGRLHRLWMGDGGAELGR